MPEKMVARQPGARKRPTEKRPTEKQTAESSSEPSDEQPWQPGTLAATTDYTVMNVFYGTDRKAMEPTEAVLSKSSPWFLATAVFSVGTILVAGIGLFRSGNRKFLVAMTLGTIVTVGLGVATTAVRVQTATGPTADWVRYGNERGEFQVGICQVSVPRYHEVGVVERPSVWRLEFSEDPRQHVVLMDVKAEPADDFYDALKNRVQKSSEKEAFVFVHGYNVTFDAAARRTAQLAYDLKFEGAPIFFSWPSQGGLLKYAVDETNVAWAVPHLREFLLAVANRTGAKSVHLIAHSMGNRALTSALSDIAAKMRGRKQEGKRPLFREVILTAPDIDADIFRRDLAPALQKTAERVTLYASSNDEALALSKKLHGYPRAGDSGDQLVVVAGIDTIDVSQIDTSLIGHSYYGSNDSVLADMFYVLNGSLPPGKRNWLQPKQQNSLTYWMFLRNAVLGQAKGAGDSTRK